MTPAMAKNDSTDDLKAYRDKLIGRLQMIGHNLNERPTSTAEFNLFELQFHLSHDLKVVRDELRTRERLMPTPSADTDIGIVVFIGDERVA